MVSMPSCLVYTAAPPANKRQTNDDHDQSNKVYKSYDDGPREAPITDP